MSSQDPLRVLRVDASMRRAGSVTRELSDKLIDALAREGRPLSVTRRDLADAPLDGAGAPPFVDAAWIAANFTAPEERDAAQRAALAGSDALIEELKAAEVIVIGAPIYNFGPPAALKAWIDQVARARVTFRYTENGPVGLLSGKRAYLVIASGGVASGGAVDFATPYLTHVLGFLGVHDVTVIAADELSKNADRRAGAAELIDSLFPERGGS